MSIDKLAKKIEVLVAERAALFEQKAPIDARLMELYSEMTALEEKRGAIVVAEQRKRNVIDFGLILKGEHHSLAELNEASRQVQLLGLYHSGTFTATNQGCIKLMMTESNLEQTFASVNLILPYLTRFPTGPLFGKRVFGIFEHSLSAHYSYQFVINDDLSCYVQAGHRTEQSFSDILSGLKYVQEYHYYERADRESDDNDE